MSSRHSRLFGVDSVGFLVGAAIVGVVGGDGNVVGGDGNVVGDGGCGVYSGGGGVSYQCCCCCRYPRQR